ncbi:MAG: hypothetical protein C0512_07405 [Flavobacterium sp.]|nr:hypothetical protein [Flavobacterium sp.]
MIILLLIVVALTVTACFMWYKFCIYLGNNLERRKNPYIKAQKTIDKNNRDYENYLKWMDKNSNGVPLNKMMTKEEYVAEQKIKSLIS